MWTVVYIAPGKRQADIYRDALEKEGFLVKVRPLGLIGQTDDPDAAETDFEVLVLESELEEALEIIRYL